MFYGDNTFFGSKLASVIENQQINADLKMRVKFNSGLPHAKLSNLKLLSAYTRIVQNVPSLIKKEFYITSGDQWCCLVQDLF